MGNQLASDDFNCIGGENWYKARCSKNFLVNITSSLFTETCSVTELFRPDEPIGFSRIQNIRLPEHVRKDYYENVRNMMYKATSGILQGNDTLALETAHLQELSLIVNSTSSYEELFVRRNAILIFLHRILRSAQVNGASLRPSLPNSNSFCTCGHLPHFDYCPLKDLRDSEKKCIPSTTRLIGSRVQRGPDWQWNDQDGGAGRQGTVTLIKDWRGIPNQGVKVIWDNNDRENVYRYGAENCYDVILYNPVMHPDYVPLMGVESPSETYWSKYIESYVHNGISKSNSLFSPKIHKSKLVKMLPDFAEDREYDESFVVEAISTLKEVLELAEQDTDDFFSSDLKQFKQFKINKYSSIARETVLFPFQIYLFSQCQEDVDFKRIESHILEVYLDMIIDKSHYYIQQSLHFLQSGHEHISDVMYALKESVFGTLMPFICTCIYIGSLSEEVTSDFRKDIENLIALWTDLLNFCQLDMDTLYLKNNNMYNPVLSESCYNSPNSSTPWFLSLLNLLVTAYSRCVPGFAPPVVNTSQVPLSVQEWSKSYLFSGGLLLDRDKNKEYDELFALYSNADKDPQLSLFMSWLDCHYPDFMKRKNARNELLEKKYMVALLYLTNSYSSYITILQQLSKENKESLSVPPVLQTLYASVRRLRELWRMKRQQFLARNANTSMSRAVSMDSNNKMPAAKSTTPSPKPMLSSVASVPSSKPIVPTKVVPALQTPSPAPIAVRHMFSENSALPRTSFFASTSSAPLLGPPATTDLSSSPQTLERVNPTAHSPSSIEERKNNAVQMVSEFHALNREEGSHPHSTSSLMETTVHKSRSGSNLSSMTSTPQEGNDGHRTNEDLSSFLKPTITHVTAAIPSPSIPYTEKPKLYYMPSYEDGLAEFQASICENLDFLFQIKQPVNIIDPKWSHCDERMETLEHEFNLDILQSFTSKTNNDDDDDNLPSTLLQTTIDCIFSFITCFKESLTKCLSQHLNERDIYAHERAQAFENAISFLTRLERYPQSARFYLLGIHRALTTISNFHSSRTPMNIFSTFVTTEHEILLTDFLSNMHGVGIDALSLVFEKVIKFCEYLKGLFERTVEQMDWRLGCTILLILASDYNTIASYLPCQLDFPKFFREMNEKLLKKYKELYHVKNHVLISAGPLWDSCVQKPWLSTDIFMAYDKRTEANDYINNLTLLHGCFPTSLFALSNCLRISYNLLMVRQFYERQWKLKRLPVHHGETIKNWSFEDAWILFGDDTKEYITVSQFIFNDFMLYIKHIYEEFKEICDEWRALPLGSGDSKTGSEMSCMAHDNARSTTSTINISNFFISAGESLLCYYTTTVTWILDTTFGEHIDWVYYSDIIWDMLYTSPRLRKLSLVALQSILPHTNYIPHIFKDDSLYDLHKIQHYSTAPSPTEDAVTSRVSTLQQEYSMVFFLLHMSIHDDFCFGAMSDEKLFCTLCCPFFHYLHKRLYDTLIEKRPELFQDCAYPFSEQETSAYCHLSCICKMLIRPNSYGAAYTNLVVADEVVYLLRLMLNSDRWKTIMSDIFDIILDKSSEQIKNQKVLLLSQLNEEEELKDDLNESIETESCDDDREYERTVWYSMASGVLKILGSLSRRIYNGCKVRINQNIMNSGNDIDSLLLSIYHSSGNGYVIHYDSSMGEALVLLDQINIPQYYSIYHLEVVDKYLPPWESMASSSPKFFKYFETIILNLEYSDHLFEIPTESSLHKHNFIRLVELQNLVLEQNAIQSLHQFILRNPGCATDLSPEFVQFLFKFSLHPSPARGVFDTVFLRFCFNHLAEQLVDTYPNSPHLLHRLSSTSSIAASKGRMDSNARSPLNDSPVTPVSTPGSTLDLKPTEEKVSAVHTTPNSTTTTTTATTTIPESTKTPSEPASSDASVPKLTKTNSFGTKGPTIRSYKIVDHYDHTRYEQAAKIAEVTDLPISLIYKIIRIYQDDYQVAFNFILEKANILKQYMANEKFDYNINLNVTIKDSAILSDLDTQSNLALLTSNRTAGKNKRIYNTKCVPYFVRYQSLSNYHGQDIRNVIASKNLTTMNDVLTPSSPTGVIIDWNEKNVVLSILNSGSGLTENVEFPKSQIGLHRLRFGNYFSSINSLREYTGRICLIYNLRLIREFLVTLLYYIQSKGEDIMEVYQLEPKDLFTFFKLMHVYSTATLSRVVLSNELNLTPASSMIYIYKHTLSNIIRTSKKGDELLNYISSHCWTQSPYANNVIKPLTNEIYCITSLHPYLKKCKYHDHVTFPKAQALRIVFDRKCKIETDKAYLAFYQDSDYTQLIARYTGDAKNFLPLLIRGNTIYYTFESQQESINYWGFSFYIQPLEGLSWSQDITAINGTCFDWICYLFDFILDLGIAYDYTFKNQDYWSLVTENMLCFLKTYGAPLKSRVTELLIKLYSSPSVFHLSTMPNISKMQEILLEYCNNCKSNALIPIQFTQLLELFNIINIYDKLDSLQTEVTTIEEVPPFPASVPSVSNTIYNSLQAIHILSRYIYYNSQLPVLYIKQICRLCGLPWNESNYKEIVLTLKKFDLAKDIILVELLTQHCESTKMDPLEFNIAEFYLSNDDRARYYILQDYKNSELRIRLGLLLLFNITMNSCICLIDLMHISQENRLGSILCNLSGVILPSIKQNVLELSIKQTIYDSKEPRPIISLDNRRIYTYGYGVYSSGKESSDFASPNALTSQCIFAQMYREMKKINISMLRAPLDNKDRLLTIKFEGEIGLDWGGLYRDTIERCIEDLFSDRIDLFVPCPNSFNEEGLNNEKYVPNPKYKNSSEAMEMYGFVGNLIGISIRTKQQIALELPSAIWKYIVGATVTLDDVESIDSSFYALIHSLKDYMNEYYPDGIPESGLQQPLRCYHHVILEEDEENEENEEAEEEEEDLEASETEDSLFNAFYLFFTVTDCAGNTVELVPGGQFIPVTTRNVYKYIELAEDYRLNEMKQAGEAIAYGVRTLIPQRALTLFTWYQMERYVCGEPDIDIHELKIHTVYSNWTESNEVVKRFWKVMESLNPKDRSQFLRFVWGRSRLPTTSNWPRPFKLAAKMAGDETLPVAHTCFFQLDLPQYSSESIMRERLLVAIHFGTGEFIIR